jgi:hypothetical protein
LFELGFSLRRWAKEIEGTTTKRLVRILLLSDGAMKLRGSFRSYRGGPRGKSGRIACRSVKILGSGIAADNSKMLGLASDPVESGKKAVAR